MCEVLIRPESAPPMSTDTIIWRTHQHLRERTLRRVEKPDRHVLTSDLQWKSKITVVGNHDRAIDATLKHVRH